MVGFLATSGEEVGMCWCDAKLHEVNQRRAAWKELGRGCFKVGRTAHIGALIVRNSCAWELRHGRPASWCGDEAVVKYGGLVGFMQPDVERMNYIVAGIDGLGARLGLVRG